MGVIEELSALVIGLRDLIDLILIISILFLIAVILRIVEKSYNIRLEIRKKDRNIFYKKELKRIKEEKNAPEKFLDNLNILIRGFFKESFDLPYHLEYLELEEEFKKLEKEDCVSFCRLISELNYSGEEISKEKLSRLISLLEKIMQENHIPTEEDKLYPPKIPSKKKSDNSANIPNITSPFFSKDKINLLPAGRNDINHINWRYKIKIYLFKLRGRIPELKTVKLER